MMRFGKRGLNIAATAAVTAATKVSCTHRPPETHTPQPYRGSRELLDEAVERIGGLWFECDEVEMAQRFVSS
jgi:hypothetical protein